MEAANRGAKEVGGRSVGCNVMMPSEDGHNRFLDKWVSIRYFFVKKILLIKYSYAFVVLPGGFGTMDEFFEVVTLIQTSKPRKAMPVVLYGSEYWNDVINFDALVRWGTLSAKELQVFYKTDSVNDAYKYLTGRLEELYAAPEGLDQIKLT